MKVLLAVVLLGIGQFLSAQPFNFVVVGDTGTGEGGQYEVARGMELFCKKESCNVGLMLGDNFYPSGVKTTCDADWEKKFEKPYENLLFKFYAVLGNHDYMKNIEAQIRYTSPRWSMPGRYYELVLSPEILILGLDTQNLDKTQLAWTEEKLKASRATWKIIMGHFPIYSGGEHGDAILTKGKLDPLLKKYKSLR